MSDRRKIPSLKEVTRHVSNQEPKGLDGFRMPIGWNFRHMASCQESEWKCTFKRLNKFTSRLMAFEGKSFQDIEIEAGSSHSWTNISGLNKKFQEIIRKSNVDTEAIWQLELTGKARLFGVREHNIFRVMWLDLNHSACPVEKKGT